MLRAVTVDEVDAGGDVAHQDDAAVVGERAGEDVAPEGRRETAVDLDLHGVGQARRPASRAGQGSPTPCSAWVMRSAATVATSAAASARTSPSDGPAGMSIPTSPTTSILAAVTHALPGPTIRSTGLEALVGSP